MPLIWNINFTNTALKTISKFDKTTQIRIFKWLEERVSKGNNPRLWGKQLKGSILGDNWCYRIGDYRILCNIQDDKLIVAVVDVGHRKDIYE